MVSQVVKTDPQWPPLEESMGQERNSFGSDVVMASSVPGSHDASAPQPMDGLQSTAPPPFLTKTYDMVDDPATDAVVSWSSGHNSFVVWNPPDFAQELLPKYFKHNNFSSFVRQLNTYGFRKVDPDRWEFANEGFLRGRRDLLRTIHRRKPATHSQQSPQPQHQQLSEPVGPCVEVGKFGLEGEIERLKRDKNILMMELVRLRQQQQNTERDMQAMSQRLSTTENRQQHMMSFLAKAMQNPSFLAQLMQQSEKTRLATTVRKKRRFPKQESSEEDSVRSGSPADNQIVAYNANGGGDGNGARAMIMQFFNSTDAASAPSLDNGPLEALFRDLGSAPSGGDVGTMNRQSGVTLTEMNTPGLSDALPGAMAMDGPAEHHELPMPPHLAARIPRLEGALNMDNGSKYSNGELKLEDFSGESMEFHGEGARPLSDGEEGMSNIGSPPTSSTSDMVFWEQFLRESPPRVDQELEQGLDFGVDDNEVDRDETVEDAAEVSVGEDGGEEKDWWSKKPNVEQLSVQMGQLAPG